MDKIVHKNDRFTYWITKNDFFRTGNLYVYIENSAKDTIVKFFDIYKDKDSYDNLPKKVKNEIKKELI